MLPSGLVGYISETELSLNVTNKKRKYFNIWLMPQFSIFIHGDMINVRKIAVASGMYASRGIYICRN
jgi:AAA15 family ATPase/GTPase